MEEFWRMFITASLAEVEACKVVGITPTGFYNLQTIYKYRSYQEEFADRVDDLARRYLTQKERNCYNNILSDIITYIPSPKNSNQMSTFRADLEMQQRQRRSCDEAKTCWTEMDSRGLSMLR